LIAFPGAEGGGQFSVGGRGGKVIEVTNLNDSGSGSLRAAVTTPGARTIVFRISGTIMLESRLSINQDSITIAGQTAPGDGITIGGHELYVNANHVIIQHIRLRPGDVSKQEVDAIWGRFDEHIMIDHISASWGVDEVLSIYGNDSTTVQWSIISESLYHSVHDKGFHGYGGIWGGTNTTFHHNLLAHHSSRVPRIAGAGTTTQSVNLDIRNNVMYNSRFQCAYGGECGCQNVLANYFKPSPATTRPDKFLEHYDSKRRWYVADNVLKGYDDITGEPWFGIDGSSTESSRVDFPFDNEYETTFPAHEAYVNILKYAGAVFPVEDEVDKRIIQEVRNGGVTYKGNSYSLDQGPIAGKVVHGIIDLQTDVGGWTELRSTNPLVDTDGDGIPDTLEIKPGLDSYNPGEGRAITKSVYSNLELYLNDFANRR